MSQDLLSAIEHTKHGNSIATKHRKKAASITSRLAGYVVSSLNTSGVGFIKSMTDVERHAELVYAESLFEKVLHCIIALIYLFADNCLNRLSSGYYILVIG